MRNNCFKSCKSFLYSFTILLLFFISKASAQDGEALFKANCTSCHAVKDKVIGPALQGVETRHTEEWLIKWVKNSQAVIKSGDEVGIKLFNDYNKVVMPAQSLKDDEIKAIFAFVKAEAEKAPPPVAVVSGQAEEKNSNTFLYLLIAAILLFLIAAVLRKVQHVLAKTVRQKEGLPEPVPCHVGKALFIGLATIKSW